MNSICDVCEYQMTPHYQINTSKQTKSLVDKNDYQISFET